MSRIPVISVVMPVYNAGRFLEAAVVSVFAQTFTDWELVAVDDASTDGSWEYLQEIDDPRVRLARNDHNMKHGATLNRAIEMARGQYIARMDADDIILPERLQRQLQALEARPEVDVLGCGTFQTDVHLNPVTVRRPVADDAAIKRLPTIRYPLTYGSLVGKASWWKRWRVDPRAVFSTSFDLFLRSHRESTFSNIPDLLYVYRAVGHTRNIAKQTRAIWDRVKTLTRVGFRMGPGMAVKTLVGLAALAPRPLIYLVKDAMGSYTAIVPCEGEAPVSPEDKRLFETGMAAVRAVQVPMKSQAH